MNRQAETDRLQAKNDYAVNVKAKLETLQHQEQINELRERDWERWLKLQGEQITLLQCLVAQGKNEQDR